MKKYVLLVLLFFTISLVSKAEELEPILVSVSETKGVELVQISGSMSAGKHIGDSFAGEYMKKVDSVEVFDMSDCSAEAKESIKEKIRVIEDGEYETVMRVQEDGEDVRVLK